MRTRPSIETLHFGPSQTIFDQEQNREDSMTTTAIRPTYIPNSDRIDRLRRPIDVEMAKKLTDSLRADMPGLLTRAPVDFFSECIKRYESMFDLPESSRVPIGEMNHEMIIRSALSTSVIKETFNNNVNDWFSTGFAEEPDTTLGWSLEVSAENYRAATLNIEEHASRMHKATKGRKAEYASIGTKAQAY
jgi:hypothetical protein